MPKRPKDFTNEATAPAADDFTVLDGVTNGTRKLKPGTAVAKNVPATGNAASGEVVLGSDTRLTDSRTPTTHATTHQADGADAIKLDDLATPDDNTDLNATTTRHGLLPKLGGGTTNFLRADGTWSAPAGGGGGGATNLWIPASAWIPRTTNGCGINSLETATNRVNYDVLEFDAAAIEYAQALVVMPSNWNAGTVTAKFTWTAASGSGDVVWQLSGRAYANDDAIDQATGTAQTATDTLTAAADLDISPATSAITLAGTAAAGNPVLFELSRKATDAGDTLAVDARLLGVEINYTAS